MGVSTKTVEGNASVTFVLTVVFDMLAVLGSTIFVTDGALDSIGVLVRDANTVGGVMAADTSSKGTPVPGGTMVKELDATDLVFPS